MFARFIEVRVESKQRNTLREVPGDGFFDRALDQMNFLLVITVPSMFFARRLAGRKTSDKLRSPFGSGQRFCGTRFSKRVLSFSEGAVHPRKVS